MKKLEYRREWWTWEFFILSMQCINQKYSHIQATKISAHIQLIKFEGQTCIDVHLKLFTAWIYLQKNILVAELSYQFASIKGPDVSPTTISIREITEAPTYRPHLVLQQIWFAISLHRSWAGADRFPIAVDLVPFVGEAPLPGFIEVACSEARPARDGKQHR